MFVVVMPDAKKVCAAELHRALAKAKVAVKVKKAKKQYCRPEYDVKLLIVQGKKGGEKDEGGDDNGRKEVFLRR